MTKDPRIFLSKDLKGYVDWAIKHDVKLITPKHMKIINNKHSDE